MKNSQYIKNDINTEADSGLKGFGLQKLRAAERLLLALQQNKKGIFCTISYILNGSGGIGSSICEN